MDKQLEFDFRDRRKVFVDTFNKSLEKFKENMASALGVPNSILNELWGDIRNEDDREEW
jgi:hypothetical protein